jgi:hypothetical protein
MQVCIERVSCWPLPAWLRACRTQKHRAHAAVCMQHLET